MSEVPEGEDRRTAGSEPPPGAPEPTEAPVDARPARSSGASVWPDAGTTAGVDPIAVESERRGMVIGASLAVVAVLIIGAFFLLADDGDPTAGTNEITVIDEGGLAPTDAEVDSAEAKSLVRTAQTAIESYATDNDGSYAGAEASELARIEQTLAAYSNSSLQVIEATAASYKVSFTDQAGTTFSISRLPSGDTVFTCEPEGTEGCPEEGVWG